MIVLSADDELTDRNVAAACSHGHVEVAADALTRGVEVGVPSPCGSRCVGPTVSIHVEGAVRTFRWGLSGILGSPAFWIARTLNMEVRSTDHRLAGTLAGEVVACILGGWGIKAEVGSAAFDALVRSGLVQTNPPPVASEIQAVLLRPLEALGFAGTVRYRFPSQRGTRVAAALQYLATVGEPPTRSIALRSWLEDVPGVGPKTAAWIARNRGAVNDVAIIDVHVRRAGIAAGFFDPAWRLPRDYRIFEESFLAVARLGGVTGAMLDACIWQTLHYLGPRRWPALLGSLAA